MKDIRRRLNLFWARVNEGKPRLEWLRNAAEWKVITTHAYIQVRRGAKRFPPVEGMCFCCQERKATATHHIIQIQNGGRNTERNRVPICRTCHQAIHPWMRNVAPILRGFSTDMRPRLVKSA